MSLRPFSATDAAAPLSPNTCLSDQSVAAGPGPGPGETRPKQTKAARRGHFKTKTGCFSCKRRRVKCDEQRPECRSCERLDLVCEYPSRAPETSHTTSIRAALATLAIEDLRFYHQFLTVAYPPLPLKAPKVWQEIAAMSYQYDHLAHAVLGIGASHLSSNGSIDFTAQALKHRVIAMKLVNRQLSRPARTVADGDALLASLLILNSQSSLMPDAMADYLTITRGANLVTRAIMPDFSKSLFAAFTLEGHHIALQELVSEQPRNTEILQAFGRSASSLQPLCTKSYEEVYVGLLVRIADLVDRSCVEAWQNFVVIFFVPSTLNNEDFLAFTDPDNHPAQLMFAHMFLLDYILGQCMIRPGDEPKCAAGRKHTIIRWVEGVIARLPRKYEKHASWLREYCSVLRTQDARYLMSP